MLVGDARPPTGTIMTPQVRTLAFGNVGSCVVLVCDTRPFDDQEFREYLSFASKIQALTEERPNLVVTEGAGPNAGQRAQLLKVIQAYGASNLKVAVVTLSLVARGIVTALGWFHHGYRAFSPDQMDVALTYLDIESPSERQSLKDLVQRLKKRLL